MLKRDEEQSSNKAEKQRIREAATAGYLAYRQSKVLRAWGHCVQMLSVCLTDYTRSCSDPADSSTCSCNA